MEKCSKNLLGGANNALSYSYPFWYINALPICLFLVSLIIKKDSSKIKPFAFFAIICYFAVHIVDHCHIFRYRLPFSLDAAIGCFPYMFCGYAMKYGKFRLYYMIVILVPLIMIFLQFQGVIDYKIDMKQMLFSSWIFDILLPLCCFICLYGFSRLLSNTILKYPLSSLGESSITIYFTHAAIIYLFIDMLSPVIVFLLAIIIGYIIHTVSKRNRLTSILLLGLNK